MSTPELASLVAAVRTAIDETISEYARLPFFVRPMVKRGFVARTGHDVATWQRLLDDAERGTASRELVDDLARLAAHYDGAPARARRGMGARANELAEIEHRSQGRAAAARALETALRATR